MYLLAKLLNYLQSIAGMTDFNMELCPIFSNSPVKQS